MNNLRFWTSSTDANYLKYVSEDALKNSGFKIVNYCEKEFKPYGFTCLFLLSESHFAIHTFPEEGKTYCELSSCVLKQYEKFKEYLGVYRDIEIIN